MTNSTQYLYNHPPSEFMNMPYHLALAHKVILAKELIKLLYKETLFDRDDQRIMAATKAIKHNEGLIDELTKKD